MVPEYEILFRLLIAGLFGGLIGLERELNDQPAGLRTHIILVLGAALAMCVSINLAAQLEGDPGRIAAQVISGIGFLGAGAIFRFGSGIKGLTTATSLWTAAIIGLAVGAGYILMGLATTAVVLFALKGLDIAEKKLIRVRTTRTILIRGSGRKNFVQEVKEALAKFDIPVKSISFQNNLQCNEIQVKTIAKVLPEQDLEAIIQFISDMEGLCEIKVE